MHFLAAIFFPLLEQFITKIKLQIWREYFLLSGSDTCGVLWGGFKGEVSLVRNASFLQLDLLIIFLVKFFRVGIL
jgi:hypothetical protein